MAVERKISVVLPCRNEEGSIGPCVKEIRKALEGRPHEIIVSVSGNDRSADIAASLGAAVIRHDKIGYGNACLEGLRQATGDYVLLVDADSTYDFSEIPRFVSELENGYDFVIGNRFKGKMEQGSMSLLHKYIGNPVLTWLLLAMHGGNVGDAHCGFKAIRRDALRRLGLRSPGMEFASEMLIKAIKTSLRIREIPINYNRRVGESKMRSFRDGWRHLRFMIFDV
jgi:glycosyltransferase involved in cell wall biosynthesis